MNLCAELLTSRGMASIMDLSIRVVARHSLYRSVVLPSLSDSIGASSGVMLTRVFGGD
jgi:hypothetical protein